MRTPSDVFSEAEQPAFVAIDGEFDQHDKRNVLSKISVVDHEGCILLDTLVNPGVSIDYSCQRIHGIDKEWLLDAPSIEDVQAYICSRFANSVFVGHGIVADLKVLNLPVAVRYTDTQWFEEFDLPENHLGVRGNKKKLKDMV